MYVSHNCKVKLIKEWRGKHDGLRGLALDGIMTLRCFRNSFHYLLLSGKLLQLAVCDGVLQGEVNKRQFGEENGKKKRHKWKSEFNRAKRCVRARKVANWQQEENMNRDLLYRQVWKVKLDEVKCMRQREARQRYKGTCANTVRPKLDVEIRWRRLWSWIVLSLFKWAAIEKNTKIGCGCGVWRFVGCEIC